MDRFLLTPFLLDREDAGLLALARDAWRINRPVPAGSTLAERMSALEEPVARHFRGCLESGDRPISVAGDCLSVLGVVAGYQRAGLSPRLLWLDAHGDFNTPETSPSGFVGGMPLAMLVGRGDQELMRLLRARPLDEARVTHFDARDLDPLEREAFEASAIRRAPTLEELARVAHDGAPLHLHLDCDLIDPRDAPAMLYPAPGGPRARELAEVLARLARHTRITSLSLSAWSPHLDPSGETAGVVMDVFAAATRSG
ncbi:MAG: arginase family protein [Thermoanaerobaculia bacterium]|nr:MAG: arginase family protein [Thermoanaerobaculia bacterium]